MIPLADSTLPPDIMSLFWQLVCVVAGLMVGSFLNVVIYRLPRGLSLVKPRSQCPGCEHEIAWYDNIPVLSWILLRARCRGCKRPIPLRYPLVEAVTGVCFGLAALMWLPHAGTTIVVCLTLAALIAISWIDLDLKIIPDAISKPGMVFGVVSAPFVLVALRGAGDRIWFDGAPAFLNALVDSAVGLGLGYGVVLLIRWLGEKAFGKEAMGLGDVKLMGFLGAVLGPVYITYVLVIACLVGAVIGSLAFLIGRKTSKDVQMVIRRKQDDESLPVDRIYATTDGFTIRGASPLRPGDDLRMETVLSAVRTLTEEDVTLKLRGKVATQEGAGRSTRTRIDLRLSGDSQEHWETFALSHKYIPFGPFLAIGGAAMLLAGPHVEWFLRVAYPAWVRGL